MAPPGLNACAEVLALLHQTPATTRQLRARLPVLGERLPPRGGANLQCPLAGGQHTLGLVALAEVHQTQACAVAMLGMRTRPQDRLHQLGQAAPLREEGQHESLHKAVYEDPLYRRPSSGRASTRCWTVLEWWSPGWTRHRGRGSAENLRHRHRVDEQQHLVREPVFEQRRGQRGIAREDQAGPSSDLMRRTPSTRCMSSSACRVRRFR